MSKNEKNGHVPSPLLAYTNEALYYDGIHNNGTITSRWMQFVGEEEVHA